MSCVLKTYVRHFHRYQIATLKIWIEFFFQQHQSILFDFDPSTTSWSVKDSRVPRERMRTLSNFLRIFLRLNPSAPGRRSLMAHYMRWWKKVHHSIQTWANFKLGELMVSLSGSVPRNWLVATKCNARTDPVKDFELERPIRHVQIFTYRGDK